MGEQPINWKPSDSEQQLTPLFAQSPGFTCILSGPEHVFTFVNEAYLRLVGQRDLIGRTVREGLPEIAGQGFYELLDQVFTTGERFVASGVPIHLQRSGTDAEERFVNFVYEPIRDASAVTGIFVQGFDATETHLAQQALRESEEFNRRVLASSADCIKVLDLDGNLTFMSEGGMGVMEVSDFNLIKGCPWPSFWAGQGNADAIAALEAARAGQTARFQGPANTMAGNPKWWDVLVSPILGTNGKPEKILSVSRDVSDTRRAEIDMQAAKDALQSANAGLEERIEEAVRERAGAEEALRQSQKMEAVGQLTGGLAHDFNNLLAVITGSLELLERSLLKGKVTDTERFLNAAQTASKRAASLTHRLLAFSRRQTLDPRPTDVNKLITSMDELIRRTAGPEIAVEFVGAGGLWTTLVDPNQLENALLNLCINARDAMPDGGRLTIETGNRWLDARTAKEREVPPGQYVSLCVSDTGCGMSPDVIAKAFDPFFTTKPIGQGTGLGLSMIYGFARQSGGQARIYSEVGQGAMVCLYIPRYLGEAIDTLEMAPAAPGRAEAGQSVLVVDDEPGIRMLVIEVLEELGYSALEASDGPAAMRIIQSGARIDLLVTDVGLPGGMNGRQLADAARTTRADLRVLFITGYAENAAIGNGHLEHGMAVMTKPFAMDALANRIKELIAGS